MSDSPRRPSRGRSAGPLHSDRHAERIANSVPGPRVDVAREWFDAYRQDWKQEKGGHWAITRDGDEVLGRIALRGLDLDDGVAGAAYWVLPAARGAKVASYGLGALTAWALNEIGFHRLELDHSTRNHASCRVATKSGYLLEGTKRSAAVHDDGRHDMHLHARIRSD
ncbi:MULTISPECIES: GNAT family N-acetyltransferase [unclassified Streptomyces]|uniref:GNAT family N-acetyltransferase n=1 Tax=unclassified Streptomyces TaxID=2593676 RepID=UPI002E3616E1|nr:MULTISPECIES: GNAT family N-acetyltransferase [unclassified Streptomyces]